MDDATAMRGSEPLAELTRDVHGCRQSELLLSPEVLPEIDAVQVLGHEVRQTLLGAIDVVDRNDVGMTNRSRRFCLAPKPRQHLLVAQVLASQHFDGNSFLGDTRMARLVCPSHCAFAHDALDDTGKEVGQATAARQ